MLRHSTQAGAPEGRLDHVSVGAQIPALKLGPYQLPAAQPDLIKDLANPIGQQAVVKHSLRLVAPTDHVLIIVEQTCEVLPQEP